MTSGKGSFFWIVQTTVDAKAGLSVFFAKKVHYLPPRQTSRTNSRNIIGRNPSMVIPSLANQGFMSKL